jgi:hypothetical protein
MSSGKEYAVQPEGNHVEWEGAVLTNKPQKLSIAEAINFGGGRNVTHKMLYDSLDGPF